MGQLADLLNVVTTGAQGNERGIKRLAAKLKEEGS